MLSCSRDAPCPSSLRSPPALVSALSRPASSATPRLDQPPSPHLRGVRVLLLQARDTPEMEHQEQACFLERCRLRRTQLACLNLPQTPLPSDVLERVDAVLIGGAGEYSALDDHAWMEPLLAFVREAVERSVPLFGSCWGHQVLARALGGHLVHDSARAELGCRFIDLTEAGQQDALFADFPARFRANTGHHDRVDRLPPGAVELAFNDSQRNQAFRVEGKPAYGTQFHSELGADRERERLIAYRDFYRADLPNEDDFQDVLSGLAETTEVDDLLHDFLVRFAGKG